VGCLLEFLLLYMPISGHPLNDGGREELAFYVGTYTEFVSYSFVFLQHLVLGLSPLPAKLRDGH